jgi:hypothetical protein
MLLRTLVWGSPTGHDTDHPRVYPHPYPQVTFASKPIPGSAPGSMYRYPQWLYKIPVESRLRWYQLMDVSNIIVSLL